MAGLIALGLAYVFSQFFRSFLAVMTPVLRADLGMTAQELSSASGIWFLTFAAMQIPLGAALDRIGPRRCASVLFLLGGAGGAVAFALASQPWHISLAMALLGVGCSPVLMSSYVLLARNYPVAVFSSYAGLILGFGNLGNLAGSAPLSFAIGLWGWRETFWGLAAIVVLIAVAIALLVRDPERLPQTQGGSLLDVFCTTALWPIFALMMVNYAAAAGLRGLWIGPYLGDTFDAGSEVIGYAGLAMGVAMIAGTMFYGPADRIFGSRKWVVFFGNLMGVASCAALGWWGAFGLWLSVALFCCVGFWGASFPLIMAHGRSFVPPHLVGRGVTVMNLFGIGGTGLGQLITARLYERPPVEGMPHGYQIVFFFFAAAGLAGVLIYGFSRDRLD